jgi:hypothetical protein
MFAVTQNNFPASRCGAGPARRPHRHRGVSAQASASQRQGRRPAGVVFQGRTSGGRYRQIRKAWARILPVGPVLRSACGSYQDDVSR